MAFTYKYADGSTGSTPWRVGADGKYNVQDEGVVQYNTPGTTGGGGAAAMSVMGYGPPTDGTFVDPSTVKPGGATFGGTDPNKPAVGTTTGNNKPMQIPNQPGAGTGGTSGGAAWGGSTTTNGGIVNSAIKPWEVTNDQTVAGNIEQLTQKESPLMQQARTRAAQQMGARGLINSSLAATAGESAVYDVANTIAQADAATKAKAAGYNVDQLNQQVTLDKQLANQMSQAQLSAETSRYSTDVNASTQKLNNESAQLIARLNNDQQATLQRMQNDNQRLLQTNQQAAQAYNNSMQYIDVINRDPNLDANAKTRAQAQIYYNLQTQLRTLSQVSGVDVTQSLSLANAPGFDDKGNYVGFNEDGTTKGTTPNPNAPPPTPKPAATGPTDNTGAGE